MTDGTRPDRLTVHEYTGSNDGTPVPNIRRLEGAGGSAGTAPGLV